MLLHRETVCCLLFILFLVTHTSATPSKSSSSISSSSSIVEVFPDQLAVQWLVVRQEGPTAGKGNNETLPQPPNSPHQKPPLFSSTSSLLFTMYVAVGGSVGCIGFPTGSRMQANVVCCFHRQHSTASLGSSSAACHDFQTYNYGLSPLRLNFSSKLVGHPITTSSSCRDTTTANSTTAPSESSNFYASSIGPPISFSVPASIVQALPRESSQQHDSRLLFSLSAWDAEWQAPTPHSAYHRLAIEVEFSSILFPCYSSTSSGPINTGGGAFGNQAQTTVTLAGGVFVLLMVLLMLLVALCHRHGPFRFFVPLLLLRFLRLHHGSGSDKYSRAAVVLVKLPRYLLLLLHSLSFFFFIFYAWTIHTTAASPGPFARALAAAATVVFTFLLFPLMRTPAMAPAVWLFQKSFETMILYHKILGVVFWCCVTGHCMQMIYVYPFEDVISVQPLRQQPPSAATLPVAASPSTSHPLTQYQQQVEVQQEKENGEKGENFLMLIFHFLQQGLTFRNSLSTIKPVFGVLAYSTCSLMLLLSMVSFFFFKFSIGKQGRLFNSIVCYIFLWFNNFNVFLSLHRGLAVMTILFMLLHCPVVVVVFGSVGILGMALDVIGRYRRTYTGPSSWMCASISTFCCGRNPLQHQHQQASYTKAATLLSRTYHEEANVVELKIKLLHQQQPTDTPNEFHQPGVFVYLQFPRRNKGSCSCCCCGVGSYYHPLTVARVDDGEEGIEAKHSNGVVEIRRADDHFVGNPRGSHPDNKPCSSILSFYCQGVGPWSRSLRGPGPHGSNVTDSTVVEEETEEVRLEGPYGILQVPLPSLPLHGFHTPHQPFSSGTPTIVFVAGGIGITFIMSLLNYLQRTVGTPSPTPTPPSAASTTAPTLRLVLIWTMRQPALAALIWPNIRKDLLSLLLALRRHSCSGHGVDLKLHLHCTSGDAPSSILENDGRQFPTVKSRDVTLTSTTTEHDDGEEMELKHCKAKDHPHRLRHGSCIPEEDVCDNRENRKLLVSLPSAAPVDYEWVDTRSADLQAFIPLQPTLLPGRPNLEVMLTMYSAVNEDGEDDNHRERNQPATSVYGCGPPSLLQTLRNVSSRYPFLFDIHLEAFDM